MAGEKVLVVDDEIEIGELLTLYLTKNGFTVYTSTTGYEALAKTQAIVPELIILDINLPDIDGIELCQQLRTITEVPIIFLSCKSDDVDKILGLTVGADDYVTKPFSPGELVARIKAILRRERLLNAKRLPQNNILKHGSLTINMLSHTVTEGESIIDLSAKEFEILALLASNPDMVFSLCQMYDSIWGLDNIGDTRTLMVHISNLRKKIEIDPRNPKYIVTVRGVGYKFAT